MKSLNTGNFLRQDMPSSVNQGDKGIREKGFTLVEILISLALMSIITIAVYQLYISQFKTWTSQDLITEMQQNGRVAIDTLSRDLLMAKYGVENAIQDAQADKIAILYKDPDVDPADQPFIRIMYWKSSDNILKRYKEGDNSEATWTTPVDWSVSGVALAENITNLSFTYFNENGVSFTPTSATLGNIYRIKASITVQSSKKDPITHEFKTFVLSTDIRPRNIGITGVASDKQAPEAPTDVEVVDPGKCGTLWVRWRPNETDTDLAGYNIYYDQTADHHGNKVSFSKSAMDTEGEYVELSGLNPNATYYISVAAYDKSSNISAYSSPEISGAPATNTRTFAASLGSTVNDTTISVVKPAPATNFTGRDGAESGWVELNWTKSEDTNVVGYRIFRSTTPFTFASYPPAGENVTLIAYAPGEGSSDKELDKNDTSFIDKNLNGCQVYYYAIIPVTCDTTLISWDAGDDDTGRAVESDYAVTYGDGGDNTTNTSGQPGGADLPTGSDTAPGDNNPPSAPTISPTAGWKAVFLDIVNPTTVATDTPDFSHTLVYFNEGGLCPTVDTDISSATYGQISNGFTLPNSDSGTRGRFITPGTVTVTHLDDDCISSDCSDKTLNGTVRNLENSSTYCYLAVAYDTCGNPRPISDTVTTLTELCGDDPVGAPGNGTKGGETWPTAATPASVAGCQANGGLDVSWQTMNHTYPSGYYDGAFYRVHMKMGNGDFSGINPTDGTTLKTYKQAELATPMTFSSGAIVSGVSDGESYYFGITATDCAYENDLENAFPSNYSSWRTIGPISPGELRRDEKCQGGGSCERDEHRAVLTGVTMAADNSSAPVSTPAAEAFRHNTVTLFFENTSDNPGVVLSSGKNAGEMTIQRVTINWVNSNARLTKVAVGGGRSGLPLVTTEGLLSVSGTDNDIIDATVPGEKRYVPITFEFKDVDNNPVDMRDDQLRVTLNVKNESTGTTTCLSYLTTNSPQTLGDILIPLGPSISAVQQNKPSSTTTAFAVPGGGESPNTVPTNGNNAAIKVESGNNVKVSIYVDSRTTDESTGNKVGISSATLYWNHTNINTDQDGIPSTGWTSVNMINTSGNLWEGTILNPADGDRIWYYIVAADSDGNYDRSPQMDEGYYTFDVTPLDPCTVTPNSPSKLMLWSITGSYVGVSWPTVNTYTNGRTIQSTDPIKYQVWRRKTSTGSFTKLGDVTGTNVDKCWWDGRGDVDGDPDTPAGGPATASYDAYCATYCPDGGSGCYFWRDDIDTSANDLTYYIVAKNSCTDPNLGKSDNSSIYHECYGAGGMTLSVTPSNVTANSGSSFTVNVGNCADGGNFISNTINNVNITTGSGLDTDIVSIKETGDNGTYTYQINPTSYSATNALRDWSCPTSADCWGYVLTSSSDTANPSDTITVSLAGATPPSVTVNVGLDACVSNPSPVSGLTGSITGTGGNQYVHLTWTASSSADKAGYKVWRKTIFRSAQGAITGTEDYKVVATVSSTTLSYNDAIGSSDIGRNDYYYYITTIDSCSTGAKESIISAGASGEPF